MSQENKIKVLIVEDELIIAEDLKMMLLEIGYVPTDIATSYSEAMEIIENNAVDIALVDILISGDKDGIELAETLKRQYHLPIIFLTSLADKKTIERAKTIRPEGYLVKPFTSKDLYTAIEIIFFNSVTKTKPAVHTEKKPGHEAIKDTLFIKKDEKLVKVNISDLKWIKADGNYVELYCTGNNKHLTRSTLKEIVVKVPESKFIQVHKSYIVNTDYITAIQYNKIFIDKNEIPVSRSSLNQLKQRLNLI